jgi:prepilin-type N-terminal cleavage/methylation domain-containing protein
MVCEQKKYDKAFTLIEILIVIAIIGILISVSVVGLSSFRENSRDSARIANVAQISLALDLYYGACKQYPATLAAAAANGCASGTTLGTFADNGIPTDPFGASYSYATSGAGNNHDEFVLRATLERENRELASDLDGVSNKGVSLDCTDTPAYYYCTGS